jgi:hypothetical protein
MGYMTMIELPPDMQISNVLTCSICNVKLQLGNATAGPFDADNRQAFACVSHFLEVEKLILGWADFMAQERARCLGTTAWQPNLLERG